MITKRFLKFASRVWRILWILWSIVITASLIALIAAVVYLELKSRNAMDPDKITLMPAPDVIAEGIIRPLDDDARIEMPEQFGIFYATGRAPAQAGDDQRFYRNERGQVLRVGIGSVTIGDQDIGWQEARRISLLKDRGKEYPLRIDRIEEFGVLSDTVTPFDDVDLTHPQAEQPDRTFAEHINTKLRLSRRKDIYLYVHGYKVVFENPLLVASELWHYMGYDGVFLAYAWPSTPNFLAYGSDLETTAYSSRNLRLLLEFLARETEAERIHILGYSAGTRLVMGAIEQLALIHLDDEAEQVQNRYRIENVVLVCSDVDRAIFGNQLADGAWRIPKQLTVYVSQIDKTLDMARFVFQRKRVGQLVEGDEISPAFAEFLRNQNTLTLIDVSRAENAGANNGHAYFHKSPWVSSDLLMMFMGRSLPSDRGLVRRNGSPLWEFPDDYLTRLKEWPQ